MSTWMDAPSPPSPTSLKSFGVNASTAVAMGITAVVNQTGSSSGTPPGMEMGAKFNPSMAIIIVVLLGTFFFMAFLSIYVKKCVTTEGDMEHLHIPWSADHITGMRWQQQASSLSILHQNGLDRASIQALPIVGFTKSRECCVCLYEFQENECLRLLPRCGHTFHVECIDRWLVSHTTCPLCRFKLTPDNVQSDASSIQSAHPGLPEHREEPQAPSSIQPSSRGVAGANSSSFINRVLVLLPDFRNPPPQAHQNPPQAQAQAHQQHVVDIEAQRPPEAQLSSNSNNVQSNNNEAHQQEDQQECGDEQNPVNPGLLFKVWKIFRCWKSGLRSSIVRNSLFS